MRSILIAICLVLVSTAALPQDTPARAQGGIFGLVSDQAARLVANAPIEARNVDTGVRFRTDSGETGLYKLEALPPGTYELSISVNTVGNFVQPRVQLTGTKPVRFDIILPLG